MDFLKKDQLPGSASMKSALNSNVWALWTIRIILVIYASFVAPNLNKAGALFFNNMIVENRYVLGHGLKSIKNSDVGLESIKY